MIKKKQAKNHRELGISMPTQDLPLEAIKQLIDQGLFKEEIPFERLAAHYPSLLKEWYPGYPGSPRMMTQQDPFKVRGVINNGKLTLKDLPGLKDIPMEKNVGLEGEYDVWLKKDIKDSWVVYAVVGDRDENSTFDLQNC